jgi:hypothetical protein
MPRPSFGVTPAEKIIPCPCVGAGMDIMANDFYEGMNGEYILNGAFAPLVGTLAKPNYGKTMLMIYFQESVLDAFPGSSASPHDTESTLQSKRYDSTKWQFDSLANENLFDDNNLRVRISKPANGVMGDAWYRDTYNTMAEKLKHRKELLRDTPFKNFKGDGYLKMIEPDCASIDSLTNFKTSSSSELAEKFDLGDSKRNMAYMNSGRAKATMIEEMSQMAPASSTYTWLTGHMGKNMSLDGNAPPKKVMQFLEQSLKALGTTDRFLYFTNNLWWIKSAEKYYNKGTGASEYPMPGENNKEGDCDIVKMTLINLRGKASSAGVPFNIIMSQSKGILGFLTEFDRLRSNGYYGLVGGTTNFRAALRPDVALSRSSALGKLLEDHKLRRAIQITSELHQLQWFHAGQFSDLFCTPEELYNDLKAKYDWDELLSTRSWWTFDNDKHPVKYLSIVDLLRMRKGLYKPYWMK